MITAKTPKVYNNIDKKAAIERSEQTKTSNTHGPKEQSCMGE